MEKTETMKHTRELWIAKKTLQGRDSSISNSRGKTIAIAYKNENIDGDDLANAKRIVACVNACAGITNDALEEGLIEEALIAYFGSYDKNTTWNNMKVWEDV
jgi:hypothetical protein